jgi:hypothetical protein
MPKGGRRVPGPGKKLGRPRKRLRLTAEEFEAMVQEQSGMCALCSEPGSTGGLRSRCHVSNCSQVIMFTDTVLLRPRSGVFRVYFLCFGWRRFSCHLRNQIELRES